MNRGEEMIKQKYEKLGWTMVHGGAPDFLAFKTEKKKVKLLFIEVKASGDTLNKKQSIWKEVLEKCGLNFRLERVGRARLAKVENKEEIILTKVRGICEHLNLSKQCTEKVKETAGMILKRIPKLKIKASASVALLSLLFNDVDVTVRNIFDIVKSDVSYVTITKNVRKICDHLGLFFPKTNRQKIYYAQLKNVLKNNLSVTNLKNGSSDVFPLPVTPNTVNSKD